MIQDKFLRILCFLHFADNTQGPDQGEENDRLWKLRTVFDKLNEVYAKLHNPSEHLSVDEVFIKFKGRGYIQAVHSKENKKGLASKFTNCDEAGYMCAVRVYLGKGSNSATDDMTATHATVTHLTRRGEGLGHKLFMEFFFHHQDFLMTCTDIK
jgi:hypothetical protein